MLETRTLLANAPPSAGRGAPTGRAIAPPALPSHEAADVIHGSAGGSAESVPTDAQLDAAPLRLYSRAGDGTPLLIDPESLPLRLSGPPHHYHRVKAEGFRAAMKRLAERRNAALPDFESAPVGHRVIPKDCTLRPSAFNLGYESGDGTELNFIRQMARIGQRENFHVVARTARGSLAPLREGLRGDVGRNVTTLSLPGRFDCWTEDHGEFTVDGTVTVPAPVGGSLIEDAILPDREERFKTPIDPASVTPYPSVNFDEHGAVDERGNQEDLVAMAVAASRPIRQNFSYVEGGNVLPGTLPNGEGYALVGRDSVAVTRELLARDLDRDITHRQALTAIAKDLGMKAENVHPVEQPGEFHLDMAMGLLGPGQVILNDAREAARLQGQWLRDDAKASRPPALPNGSSWLRHAVQGVRYLMWHRRCWQAGRLADRVARNADRVAAYETRTLKDLQDAGLQVYRMAAVFVNPSRPSEQIANFANLRQGTNDRGERYVIALGGDRRAEQYVARKFLREIPCDVRHVWFLDRELTPATLELQGGIKCRTKAEGTIASGLSRLARRLVR